MSYFVLPFLLAHATDFFLVFNPYFIAVYLNFSNIFLEKILILSKGHIFYL